jgi:hypothetical protein
LAKPVLGAAILHAILAHVWYKYIHKGQPLLVEGRLDVSEKGYFNVVAERIVYGVTLKRDGEGETGYASAKNTARRIGKERSASKKT